MFRRAIDDLKASISSTISLASLMVAAALTLFIAFWFAFAAGFVYLRDRYGAIEACLAGAGFFLLVTLIVAGIYAVRKRQARMRAAQRARESARAMLADPQDGRRRASSGPRHGTEEAGAAARGRRSRFGPAGRPQQPRSRPDTGRVNAASNLSSSLGLPSRAADTGEAKVATNSGDLRGSDFQVTQRPG